MSQDKNSVEYILAVEERAASRRRVFYTILSTITGALVGVFLLTSTGSNLRTTSKATTVTTLQALSSSSTRVYYDALESSEKKSLFEDFKTQFGKTYATDEEEAERYKNFKKFLKLIDKRNNKEEKKDNTAVHGVTQFSDLSEDEIKKYLLGYKSSDKEARRALKLKSSVADVPKYKGTATAVNWADVYTTSVRDQGYCGSCWAYSASEQLESDSIRNGYLTTSDKLSVQQLVSCDTVDLGCSGGNTETAYSYIESAGGLELESSYPYTSYFAITGTCSINDNSVYSVTLSKYYTLEDEDAMQDYVLSTGPLSICAAASSWTSYSSGILSTCDDDVDHCVQVTGIDVSDSDSSYWIIRNSWGTSWGNSGYIYIKSGENLCNISHDPTYTVPEAVSRRK